MLATFWEMPKDFKELFMMEVNERTFNGKEELNEVAKKEGNDSGEGTLQVKYSILMLQLTTHL